MKPFAEFLQERYVEGQVKELELMRDGALPLSPSVLQKFEIFIPKTYHVTSFSNVENVVKLQGKRKDIATFTKGSEGISKGAIEYADILFTLEGYSSFNSQFDFSSRLDRNGIRWIRALNAFDRKYVVNNTFKIPLFKLIEKKFKLSSEQGSVSKYINTLDNKGKAIFIKFYFEQSKKLITKSFLDTLQASLATAWSSARYNNNEILLHGFKITKVELIMDELFSKEVQMSDLRKYSTIKVNGTIDRSDIAKIRGK